MELNLNVSQKQILSQHMVQSMEILQMSAQELDAYIEKLSIENPVIDLEDRATSVLDAQQADLQRKLDWLETTDYQNKVYYQADHSDQNSDENLYSRTDYEETLSDYLFSQIMLKPYSEEEHSIIEFIILSLDNRGYLSDDLSIVCEEFKITHEQAMHFLNEVQLLDPAGVGARNLSECLILQLDRLGLKTQLAEDIITFHLNDIAKNHLKDIARSLDVSIDEVLNICELIQTLNPKPGSTFSNRDQLRYISPDAIVVKLKDKFEILVNEYQYPRFHINTYYQELQNSTNDAETKKYLSEKIQQAKWVSGCIEQRTSTLSKVMHALVDMQYDFFQNGPGHKKPLRLSDIAAEVNLHESTISRTLRSKYLQCSWGVFPLNYFLTSVANKSALSSEEKTVEQVKQCIREIINNENKQKPLSDQAISKKLEENNIHISRRTVNKYRTEMNIPDKSGRKKW